MRRRVRPMNLEYKGARTTFNMPGWYCDASTEGRRPIIVIGANAWHRLPTNAVPKG